MEVTWKEIFVRVDPDGSERSVESNRSVVLTDEVHGEADDYLLLRSLYCAKVTGKYARDATKEDEPQESVSVAKTLTESCKI